MSCNCNYVAKNKYDEYICKVSNEECIFDEPDSMRCSEMYGIYKEDKPIQNYSELEKEKIIDEIIDEEGDFLSEEDELDELIDEEE